MTDRWENNGNSDRLYFGGLQNHCRCNCSHEIKRCLLLGRKVITNLDRILKSRDITLLTKVHLVKVFSVIMYRPESWTIKKFSSVQLVSRVWLFATLWTTAHQASLSITNSWSLPKLMSIESVMPPNISSSVVPFSSCLQSFPTSGPFSVSQFFALGGQVLELQHQSFQWIFRTDFL